MQTKRTSFVILKMVKNNQYGQAMTKPLPYGCVKENKSHLLFMNLIKFLIQFLTKIKSVTYL